MCTSCTQQCTAVQYSYTAIALWPQIEINDPYAQPAQFLAPELELSSVTNTLADFRRTSCWLLWLGSLPLRESSGGKRLGSTPGHLQPQTPSRRRGGSSPTQRHSPQATMEAKGSEDETKDAKEEEPPSKVVIDLLNFAMRVVHEEMSGFFEQPDRGVPRCCGAFTPSS